MQLRAIGNTITIEGAPPKAVIEARLQDTRSGHLHVEVTPATDELGTVRFDFPGFGQHTATTLRILDDANDVSIIPMVFDPIDSDEGLLVFITAADYIAALSGSAPGVTTEVPYVPQPDLDYFAHDALTEDR